MKISRAIVSQKIRSMLKVLRDYRRNHPDAFPADEFDSMKAIEKKVASSASFSELLGYEGSASAIYFKLFGKMLKPPWKFSGRNRRPPKDPVNAVLSFGYVVVGSEIQSLLDGIGFDPYLGYYHASKYGRPSLALDLLEEFRHSFVDRFALNLFNQHIFAKEDFYTPPKGGIHLNTEGKAKFFTHYEKIMGSYPGAAARKTNKRGMRARFQKQVYNLSGALQKNAVYKPWTG
jgi:CRISPR-associated protein Cas1